MFDHFLTSLLQIVIVVDLVGAFAYLLLGVLRQRQRRADQPAQPPRFELISIRRPFWRRLLRPSGIPAATESDFARLKQILSSFQEGLS